MRGKFELKGDMVYKMPVHFGGDPFYPVRTVYGDMTVLSLGFYTEEGALLEMLPKQFDLKDPVVNIQFAECRDVDWMSGGEYRLIQASVPVTYMGSEESLDGEYMLVIWENKTCPIIGGREEDGMPKIYADIAALRHNGDHWFTAASYECNTFLRVGFDKGRALEPAEVDLMNRVPLINCFGWRYIPKLGMGGASLSHATLYPQEKTIHKGWEGDGRIEWPKFEPEMNLVQYRTIKAMSDLPVLDHRPALMLKTSARLNVGDSRSLK